MFSPKIWRCPAADFYGDEPMDAREVYTPEVLQGIRREGFDAIWLRGRLGALFTSNTFPELNTPDADRRIDRLQCLIERGRQEGLGIYLFFNEPLAIPADHPFWNNHEALRGEPYHDPVTHQRLSALCTSRPEVRSYVSEGIEHIFDRLTGLTGVVLITATELHTHCWSHHIRRGLDDGFTHPATEPMRCPRCREREPAEVVAELVTLWRDAAAKSRPGPAPRILVWNWSWSIWYPDPQAQVIRRLPAGVELMADWERGGTFRGPGKNLPLDEYSLAYAGPSERFLATQQAAQTQGLMVHAKLQIGTTHEIATVPNLPLIENLHAKLLGLFRHRVRGAMATWNFGCALTLNSFAFGLFTADPDRYADRDRFFGDLVRQYFGLDDSASFAAAWHCFAQAFDHYPFSIRFLYTSPLNYAPAYPLLPTCHDRAMGPSWIDHPWGDRLKDCLGPFTLAQATQALDRMVALWHEGLAHYTPSLEKGEPAAGGTGGGLGNEGSGAFARHRREEGSCAMMIGVQLKSMANLLAFYQWLGTERRERDLTGPCEVPLDETGGDLIRCEIENAQQALALTRADPRLGYHQEPQAYLYSPTRIQAKIDRMRTALAEAGFHHR